MRNDINKDNVISTNDINKLRVAYKNYNISEDYIKNDVKNIMIYENLSKDQAINHILKIINLK